MCPVEAYPNAVTLQSTSAFPSDKTYTVRVGSVSGTSYTNSSSNYVLQTSGVNVNDFITFLLDTPGSLIFFHSTIKMVNRRIAIQWSLKTQKPHVH